MHQYHPLPTLPPPSERGIFITFEGGEGTGKTTQIQALSQFLLSQGISHIMTREPGGTPHGEALRALLVRGAQDKWTPLSELLLMQAGRLEHVNNRILPALTQGQWVLCDRFIDSTMAYQGYGQQLGKEVVQRLQILTLGTFQPDLTFLLTAPTKSGLQRKRGTEENRFEQMGIAFHQRVHTGYQHILKENPARCIKIPENNIRDTAYLIQHHIQERFQLL